MSNKENDDGIVGSYGIRPTERPRHHIKRGRNGAEFCPTCGFYMYLRCMDGSRNKYCGQCGAALDWSAIKGRTISGEEDWDRSSGLIEEE